MPSISCGECTRTHESVAEVKVCHGLDPFAPSTGSYDFQSEGPVPDATGQWQAENTNAKPKPAPRNDGVTEEGMYKHDDVIYKVVRAASGYLYAKRLGPREDAGLEFTDEPWVFHYAPGKAKDLRASEKLDIEDAKAFGRISGICCVCGRRLTNELSIKEGIGPVCGGRWQ